MRADFSILTIWISQITKPLNGDSGSLRVPLWRMYPGKQNDFPYTCILNVHWEEFAPKKHTYTFMLANTEKHTENAVCLLIAFPLSILFKKKKKKSPLKEYGILAEMVCSFLTPGGEGARTLCSFSCIQLSQVWTYTKACKTFTTKHPPGILRTFYLY